MNKVAIVTGGSRGIGRAIAETLARRGAAVVINYRRDSAAADAVVQTITGNGGLAVAVRADLSRVDDVRRLFASAIDRFGTLDTLVNNAGIAEFSPLADVTESEFDTQFNLNVKGVLFAMQEAGRVMGAGGRIVNISSGITQGSGAGASVYAASKAAMEQITRAAAAEFGGRGITVNCVSPGMTGTDLLTRVVPEDARLRQIAATPLGRLGHVQDIADVAAFLVSDEARWITGQNIRATGGAL